MAWDTKSKNSIPTTVLKDKIEEQSNAMEIRTPDNCTILVGSSENLALIYLEGFNDWNLKTKIPA